jgi:hypothetical protein
MGCFTTTSSPKKAAPVPARFSFAESEEKAVPITFIQERKVGVRLVDCNEITRPNPAEGTYWERDNLFPVEKPLNLRVYIYWDEDQYGERRRGVFKCPPLEANKEYKLWYKGNLKGGSLILTYANVGSLNYSSSGKPNFEIVYEQIIPPPPK